MTSAQICFKSYLRSSEAFFISFLCSGLPKPDLQRTVLGTESRWCLWSLAINSFTNFNFLFSDFVGLLTIQPVSCIGCGAINSMTWKINVKFLTYALMPLCGTFINLITVSPWPLISSWASSMERWQSNIEEGIG